MSNILRVYKLQMTNYKNMLVPAIYIDATFFWQLCKETFNFIETVSEPWEVIFFSLFWRRRRKNNSLVNFFEANTQTKPTNKKPNLSCIFCYFFFRFSNESLWAQVLEKLGIFSIMDICFWQQGCSSLLVIL